MFNVLGAFVTGFARGLSQDAANDAYQQELHEHPDENVPTHVAHAIGRFLGLVIGGGS